MNQNHSSLFRRTLCAVCAFAFLLTLAGPAAYAAGEAAPAATELDPGPGRRHGPGRTPP